jgi:Zn-finger nucleic acid-binding protein
MDLATIQLHGISVDQCGNCGGVFFDAGEVEQLMQKDSGVMGRVLSIFR